MNIKELPFNHTEATHIIEVPPDVNFIYIMRKDTKFVAGNLAQTITIDCGVSPEIATPIICQAYDTFTVALGQALITAFSNKGNVELHFFEAELIEKAEIQKADGMPIVSLDPLLFDGVIPFCVSRGFYPGGVEDIGQIARPGSATLINQAIDIAQLVGERPVCVIEDDIFSGGSVISALEHLQRAGITIAKLIPGIQIGKPTKLDSMGITVDPVVTYMTTDNTDIFGKVDLGDPRDYLLGASGLVVKLSDGSYGRVPYLLPFVSTSVRASIPKDMEASFAQAVWKFNAFFFKEIQQALGLPILLKHMDEHFVAYMQVEHGVDGDTPMLDLVAWASRQVTLDVGEGKASSIIEKIEDLNLPSRLIFLDVNGTLLPDDSESGKIDNHDLYAFKNVVKQLQRAGIGVGLCSDSPLPELIKFAQFVGIMNPPIIAENGNVLWYQGDKVVIKELAGVNLMKQLILNHAIAMGYTHVVDTKAVEFGGQSPRYSNQEWAFGTNRETSISVFGPEELIVSLGKLLNKTSGISVDCSPEYNFLGVHPDGYKGNKGILLSMLVDLGHEVTMIGNSKSDWVSPESGVMCTFVAGSRISEEIKTQAGYISPLPTIQGVTDILQKLYL